MINKMELLPGLAAEKFLETRIAQLRNSNAEEGLAIIKEEISCIFNRRYEQLRQDTNFIQVFFTKKKDLRGEQVSLGEILSGAFSLLERFYSEKKSGVETEQERNEVMVESFHTGLKVFEDIFIADYSVFESILVMMFLSHTYQREKLVGDKLKQAEKRFREFVDKNERLLRFFYCLEEFNRLNRVRLEIDQGKKSSLSVALEEEIQGGGTIDTIKRELIICRKLEFLARSLIELSEGHDPLDGVRRLLAEVYSADENQSPVKGLLDKFYKYSEFELKLTHEALLYKRIIHLNSGSRAAKNNRNEWLKSFGCNEVERLVNMLEIKNNTGGRLSSEQKIRQELYLQLRKKLDTGNSGLEDNSKSRNMLVKEDINLLVLRLGNGSLLEEQISLVEKKIENYRRENKMDYQNTVVRSYSDNISKLSQCLYFFLEFSKRRNPALGKQGKDVLSDLQKQMKELETKILSGMPESMRKLAGESVDEPAAGSSEDGEQETISEARGRTGEGRENLAKELDPREKTAQLAKTLKDLPESSRIKPLKDLAYFGTLESLQYLLPLYQSSSGFLQKLTRSTVIKIILRELKEDESRKSLGIQQKKKLIYLVVKLDNKYSYLKNMDVDDPKVRQKILDILIKEDRSFTARTLAEIIMDSDERVRATVVKLMSEMLHQEESWLLLKLLGDRNPRVRANVIESLEETGNSNVLGILMKYKFDKDNRVRANALKAIWNFGYRDVLGPLEEMILDSDPEFRASSTWVIGEIGHNQPELKNLLNVVKNDSAEIVSWNFKMAIRKIARREEGLRVLIADDDEEFSRKILRGMAADGYKTRVALDGKATLYAADKYKPHIVLLDLRLPVMNGLEVIKALREKEDSREIPIIVFFDFNSSVMIKKTLEAGATCYLLKPCSYEDIKTKLQSFI
jgi:CheY-like chemotaxis protein